MTAPAHPGDNVAKSSPSRITYGDFRYLLKRAMEARGLTPTQYARRMKMDNGGFITLVLQGKRGVPLEKLDDWISALDVSDEEYAALFLRALEDYASPVLIDLINRMEELMRYYHDSVTTALKRGGVTIEVPPPPSVWRLLADRSRQRPGRPTP